MAGSTGSAGTGEFQAASVGQALVSARYLDRKTRELVLASSTTSDSIGKGFSADGFHGVVHVMV